MWRMMRNKWLMLGVCAQAMATGALAQGCDMLLRDGVFNTFNKGYTRLAFDEWHQKLCTAEMQQTSSSSSMGGGANVVLEGIPFGMNFEEAKAFQSSYRKYFCGGFDRTKVDFTTEAVFQKAADPGLVQGYVQCREVETKGLRVLYVPGSTNPKAFTLSVRFEPPVQSSARITTFDFAPAGSVTCTGDLKPPLRTPITLAAIKTLSAICTRVRDEAVTLLFSADAGSFTREIAAVTPPPSETERVLNALPRGTILPHFNPSLRLNGWQPCNGNATTPDLADRYAVGTSDASKIGTKTGSAAHSHDIDHPTSRPRQSDGGKEDGRKLDSPQGQPPEVTGLDHYHRLKLTLTGSNIPPSTAIMYLCKL